MPHVKKRPMRYPAGSTSTQRTNLRVSYQSSEMRIEEEGRFYFEERCSFTSIG